MVIYHKSNKMDKDNEFLWNQFCRLGEMIGDGLHYEEPWITKEYKRLQKILLPETEEEKTHKREIRKSRNKNLDDQITERLKTDRCVCGSELRQSRSGSKVVVCTDEKCAKRFRYKTKKK